MFFGLEKKKKKTDPCHLSQSDHTRCTWSSHSEELVLGSWSDIESHCGVSTRQTLEPLRSAWSPLGSSAPVYGSCIVSSPTRSSWVGLSATAQSFSSMSLSLWEQNPTSAMTSWGRTTTPAFSSSCGQPLPPACSTLRLESVSEEVDETRVMPWGFMSWNHAMMLPSRLAFAANADGSWLPHVFESIVSLEEEKRPVDELLPPGATGMGREAPPYARRRLSWCCTEALTLVAAE